MHKLKKRQLKNKLLNTRNLIPFAEIFSKMIALVNMYLLIHMLHVSDFADYSYIIAIVLWSSVLMDGGINNLVFNKSLKNNLNDINVLFSARFLLSSIIIFVLASFFYFKKPELVIPAVIYTIVIYFSSTSAFVKMLARGKEYHKIDLIVIITEPILKLVLFTLVYFFYNNNKWDLWLMMSVYLAASIVAFVINYYFLSKYYTLSFFTGKFKTLYNNLKTTLQASKYYLLYYFIYIGLSRVDVIFIEEYSSKSVLALFSSAIMLYGVMQLFFLTIITSKFKKIFNEEKKAIGIIFVLLLFVVIATNVLSSYVYLYLLPKDYKGGDLVLNSIIWALIPSVLNYYFTAKLNFEYKTKFNAIIMFLPLLYKIIVYNIFKPQEITMYQHTYVASEYLLLFFFIIYFLFRKKIKE